MASGESIKPGQRSGLGLATRRPGGPWCQWTEHGSHTGPRSGVGGGEDLSWTSLWRSVSIKGTCQLKGRCGVKGQFCVFGRKVVEQFKRKEGYLQLFLKHPFIGKQGAHSRRHRCPESRAHRPPGHFGNPEASATPHGQTLS